MMASNGVYERFSRNFNFCFQKQKKAIQEDVDASPKKIEGQRKPCATHLKVLVIAKRPFPRLGNTSSGAVTKGLRCLTMTRPSGGSEVSR